MTHSLFAIESAKFHKDMGYDRASASFFIASVALSPTRIFRCVLDLEDKGRSAFALPFARFLVAGDGNPESSLSLDPIGCVREIDRRIPRLLRFSTLANKDMIKIDNFDDGNSVSASDCVR